VVEGSKNSGVATGLGCENTMPVQRSQFSPFSVNKVQFF